MVRSSVERSAAGGPWMNLGLPAGRGETLEFSDTTVTAGTHYDYRLAIPVQGGILYRGLIGIDVPTHFDLSLAGFTPNPSTGAARLAFALPSAAAAGLEVLDIMGRRVFAVDVGSLGAGRHEVDITPELRVGMYFIRLHSSGRTLTRRGIVIR
jgi:hypothetical protein